MDRCLPGAAGTGNRKQLSVGERFYFTAKGKLLKSPRVVAARNCEHPKRR